MNGAVTAIKPVPAPPATLPAADLPIPKLADVERVWVLYALQALKGDRRAAAKALGVSVKTIYNKIARYRREGCLP